MAATAAWALMEARPAPADPEVLGRTVLRQPATAERVEPVARVAQEAAAQRKELPLASGKFVSRRKRPIEELGGAEILAKIPLEDGPDAGQFAGLHQLVVGGGWGGQQEVVADRVG